MTQSQESTPRQRNWQNHAEALRHLLQVDVFSLAPIWGGWIMLNWLFSQRIPLVEFIDDGALYIYSAVGFASALNALRTDRGIPRRHAGHWLLSVTSLILLFVASIFFSGVLVTQIPNVRLHISPERLVQTSVALFLIAVIHSYFAQAIAHFQPMRVDEGLRRQQSKLEDEFDRRFGDE